MPEGDTVHKIAGYLRPRLAGRTIEAGRVRGRPDIVLAGRRITEVTARGKHLFLALDDGTVLRSHLGMHGSWHRYPVGRPWRRPAAQSSIEIEAGGQVYVCFRAEEVEHLRQGSVRDRQLDARLGPDLAAGAVDLDAVLERARRFVDGSALAADLLLDQRVASGIGNVYKSEVLFLERTHPRMIFARLDGERLRALYATAGALLRENVRSGPRVTRPVPDGGGPLWVYGRLGRPCFRCGTAIAYARLGRGNRSTYWCPRCQPEGD